MWRKTDDNGLLVKDIFGPAPQIARVCHVIKMLPEYYKIRFLRRGERRKSVDALRAIPTVLGTAGTLGATPLPSRTMTVCLVLRGGSGGI